MYLLLNFPANVCFNFILWHVWPESAWRKALPSQFNIFLKVNCLVQIHYACLQHFNLNDFFSVKVIGSCSFLGPIFLRASSPIVCTTSLSIFCLFTAESDFFPSLLISVLWNNCLAGSFSLSVWWFVMTSLPTFLVREYSIVLFFINFHITVLRSEYEIKYRCMYFIYIHVDNVCIMLHWAWKPLHTKKSIWISCRN